MRIGHLLAPPPWPSGTFDPVRPLVHMLHDPPAVAIDVFALGSATAQPQPVAWSPVPIVTAPPGFPLAREIDIALAERDVDLLHVHGTATCPLIICRRWSDATGKPYLISPHGRLTPPARPMPWRARLAKLLYGNPLLAGAACMHASDEQEAQQLRGIGVGAPICIIRGPAAPSATSSPGMAHAVPQGLAGSKILLHLGPLRSGHAANALLRGWSAAREDHPDATRDWRLVVAGDHGRDQALPERWRRVAGITAQVHMLGTLTEATRRSLFQAATACVAATSHPDSRAAILAAWCHGLPVLMRESCCELDQGFAYGAAKRIQCDPASIARAIGELVRMDARARADMGAKGRLLAHRLSGPAAEFAEVYRWLLGRGPLPACVHVH